MGMRLKRALHRALRVLTRRVRAASGHGGFVLQPYRGYGSGEEVFLIGRVFRQPTFGSGVVVLTYRPAAEQDAGQGS